MNTMILLYASLHSTVPSTYISATRIKIQQYGVLYSSLFRLTAAIPVGDPCVAIVPHFLCLCGAQKGAARHTTLMRSL